MSRGVLGPDNGNSFHDPEGDTETTVVHVEIA